MIDPDDIGDFAADVGRRLRLSRRALGDLDQQEFGEEAGLSQSRYNKFETGSRPLTLEAAMKLCERWGLTLDWLYRGDPSGLPHKLVTDIRGERKKDQISKESQRGKLVKET
jgi:transcriptional regulator with XRE-family HTH domain